MSINAKNHYFHDSAPTGGHALPEIGDAVQVRGLSGEIIDIVLGDSGWRDYVVRVGR